MMVEDTVRVAVRIRPLVKNEIEKGCQICLEVVPGEPQIHIRNTDKAFTFNYVFTSDVSQEDFYKIAIKNMVTNIFHGYNVTILAYGQTGSGKTHSMGTNYTGQQNMGIIPRAMYEIFEIIASKQDWIFKVTVSFLELYQEQLHDLLTDKQRNESSIDIREDTKGIKVIGITEKEVSNAEEALKCLTQGSSNRATGATAMNAHSSRSHAIFTLSIHQQNKNDSSTATTAKFHFVDLAGSERSKKTQATGERFKEGVNINKGLLALGNVISQLGESGPTSYVGYRDSKLTRLLQDSLGGNSMTLMVACVSPADYNLDETISTLRYADRARKIKNKPVINQDPKTAEINRLNKLVSELRLALVSQEVSSACPAEHQELVGRNQFLQNKMRDLTENLNATLTEIVILHERAELEEQATVKIRSDLTEILEKFKQLLESLKTDSGNQNMCLSELEAIYTKLLDIQRNQEKTVEDLINYDPSSNLKSAVNGTTDLEQASADNINIANLDTLEYFDEKHEEHALLQTERNNQVQNINRELALKEGLINQLLQNSSQIAEQSRQLKEMEQELRMLQDEKQQILQALQNVQTSNASSKLAESRHKKIQELEKKIAELSGKCLEQNKLVKMKEKQDQQIKDLLREIQSLKSTKVKLIRQMRNESDMFTKWKHSRQKEVNRLRAQDRKREGEMARLKMQHNKQSNVFKRKMEEAFAVNKRLKDALEMQKTAIQTREKMSNKENIRTWVEQELEILVSTVDAEYSLQKLMQDRASLASNLDKLKNSSNVNQEEVDELTEFLSLRNAQITDLQQKILESDQENRANMRYNIIQSMADAKAALKMLFEITAEHRKTECGTLFEYNELLEKYGSLEAELVNYQRKEQDKELPTTDETVKLREELEFYKEKYERLEQMASTQADGADKKIISKPKGNKKVAKIKEEMDYNTYPLTDDSFEDDVEKDPDWTKTPLYHRIQKLWNTSKHPPGGHQTTLKRSLDSEVKCACKTKCATRLCTCRKNHIVCNNCNCNPATCQNTDKENLVRTLFSDSFDDSQSNDAIKRPRLKRTTSDTKLI